MENEMDMKLATTFLGRYENADSIKHSSVYIAIQISKH